MNMCDICKGPVKDESIDVMISVTLFDETGEPRKTMEPIHLEPEYDQDYVTVCTNCKDKVLTLWNKFLDGLDDI